MNNIKSNNTVKGAIAICIAATLWGLDGIVLTPRLHSLDISLVVFVLHALPFTLMCAIFSKEIKLLKTFSFQDYVGFILVAIFGGFLGTYAIVKALFLVDFQQLTIVVLLQKLQPIFAIILAAIILKEKFQKNFLLWASIAIVAGYFLTFGFNAPNFNPGNKTGLAALYSLLAAFSFGASTVISKKILFRFNFVSATYYRFGFTAVIAFIILLFSSKVSLVTTINPNHWLIFLIIGLTTGSGAIFLYYYGLRKVKAMVSSICELCYPISAIIFDYIFNGKVLSPIQWVSATVMIIAIYRLSKN
ncbi:MAG: DMT family transporter [Bacteroidales bacterium]